MFVDRNFLYQLSTFDPHFLLSQKVLNYDVCHIFPARINYKKKSKI
jgi:hypothetical protein